jgi:hypothetical protein
MFAAKSRITTCAQVSVGALLASDESKQKGGCNGALMGGTKTDWLAEGEKKG